MELAAAKLIGAGLAVLGVNGAALGVGRIFASLIDAIGRNPAAKDDMTKFAFMGAAFAEALGIFALLVAFLIFL
jgi:F0F1-type ATP synthase membrane subunit c/vacuolar-type H+-ATPase subunit K